MFIYIYMFIYLCMYIYMFIYILTLYAFLRSEWIKNDCVKKKSEGRVSSFYSAPIQSGAGVHRGVGI